MSNRVRGALVLGALALVGCTSTGGVDPDLGKRAADDALCIAAMAAASQNPVLAAQAVAQCQGFIENAAQDAEAARLKAKEIKAR